MARIYKASATIIVATTMAIKSWELVEAWILGVDDVKSEEWGFLTNHGSRQQHNILQVCILIKYYAFKIIQQFLARRTKKYCWLVRQRYDHEMPMTHLTLNPPVIIESADGTLDFACRLANPHPLDRRGL
ncbi:hypothetical protein B0J15DRAFT_158507 [Fusarium solani]|uniref:Uncharacterized protein n=1 Tax=Fusarium solani TaxID=169388 RepID=A0A9P9G5K3_FUSSL|nr:uncharacterized protein B0J15DRAFT_158507 [Fusarium solani]KAH7232430.1 hypothetical protein B0J15DRAFT_158507 [Fusarium solani]